MFPISSMEVVNLSFVYFIGAYLTSCLLDRWFKRKIDWGVNFAIAVTLASGYQILLTWTRHAR